MIDRDQLYGAGGNGTAAAAAIAGDLGQTSTYRIPRTAQPAAPLAPPFLAVTLSIDNATGRWWRVAGRWIPPWTVGAVVPVVPPSAQLTVERITPAGQYSEAAGEELVIVATSAAQPLSAGIYTPPAAGFSLVHAHEAQLVITTAGGPPSPRIVVGAPLATERYGLVRLRANMTWESSNRHTPATLYAGFQDAFGTVVTRASLSVSWHTPETVEQTFSPPLLWPTAAEVAAGWPGGLANLAVVGRQYAYVPPTRVDFDVSYLLLEA